MRDKEKTSKHSKSKLVGGGNIYAEAKSKAF